MAHRAHCLARPSHHVGLRATHERRLPSPVLDVPRALSRHSRVGRSTGAAHDGRCRLRANRSSTSRVRDLVDRAPLHLLSARTHVLPPDQDRRDVSWTANQPRVVDRVVARAGRVGGVLSSRAASDLKPPPPTTSFLGARRDARRLLGGRDGASNQPTRSVGWTVLPVALHDEGAVVARAPLFTLGAPSSALYAGHSKRPRRP